MNGPPKDFVRVAPDAMRGFVTAAFETVGVSAEDAGLLAGLLVKNDLRGVFSHGTWQVRTYVGLVRDRRLNPQPRVAVVSVSFLRRTDAVKGVPGRPRCVGGAAVAVSLTGSVTAEVMSVTRTAATGRPRRDRS